MIKLEQVSVTYPGGLTALQPTSIEFREGEITVLLGASGAGKSTLLRCLNYLTRPTSGAIEVIGLGQLSQRPLLLQHRRRTGMIFQQHQLIGRLSVLQNVLTGRLGYHSTLRSLLPLPRKDQLIALEALERVGLLEKALERVDNLSGGQQQRVGIARAIAQRPTIVLADEPVASLDPHTAERVLDLLRVICTEDHIPAVVSLHQLDLAKRFADRVVGISAGHIVYDGAPDALTDTDLQRIYQQGSEQSRSPEPTAYPALPLSLVTEE
jgi:phosphonate transport system ATP-binding protein